MLTPTQGTLAPQVRSDAWEFACSQKPQSCSEIGGPKITLWETFFCVVPIQKMQLIASQSNYSSSQPLRTIRTCPALYYMISRHMTQVLPEQTQVQTVITNDLHHSITVGRHVGEVAASAELWSMNAGKMFQQASRKTPGGPLTGLAYICKPLGFLLLCMCVCEH